LSTQSGSEGNELDVRVTKASKDGEATGGHNPHGAGGIDKKSCQRYPVA
jgi:hypothetical protein